MSNIFRKSRGMPTLSLKASVPYRRSASGAWGRVCVLLFLFICVILQLTPTPLFAQDTRNRTSDMYHLGRIITSSESLPDRVYDAQKYKFFISVLYLEKGTDNVITSGTGSGFTSNIPGIILTARHVVSESIPEADKIKTEMMKTNPRFDYTYSFMGTIMTSERWVNFPLTLAATGEEGTFKDILALRVNMQTMLQARVAGDVINSNPLNILMRPSEFADANVGDKVYISGFAPVVAGFKDKNKNPISVYVDLINFTFPAEVTAKIEDMPINKAGVKLLYRLRDGAEPGFSGGMVVNARGQVIGMTVAISSSKNFVYAISSKDIKDFLKDNRLR